MLGRMLVGLGVALLVSAPASAQEDYGRTGFYLGVQGSTALFTTIQGQLGTVPEVAFVVTPPPPVDRKIAPSLGVHARAGYRFLPHFAAETHLEYLSGAKIYAPTQRFETTITELTALTLTADMKGYLSTGMIQPYGLIGVGWMKTRGRDIRKNPAKFEPPTKNPLKVIPITDPIDTNDNGMVGRFGAGVDVYVTQSISMGAGASYVMPLYNWGEFDYNYISLDWGLQYRF
jgi:opacity protein-like surface antigen